MSDNDISIIIPMYNAEECISNCIEAILKQSYEKFELLLINDGSKDGTLNICRDYALNDKRIKILDKANGGVSSARNLGIDYASSSWICFVDADDTIEVNYLENLMDSREIDFVISGLNVYSKGNVLKVVPESIELFSRHDRPKFIDLIDKKGFILHGPYQKRFKKKILKDNNIRFDLDICYGEDTLFVLKYLFHSESFKAVPFADYNYYLAENDNLSSKASYKKRNDYVLRLYVVVDEYFKKGLLGESDILVLQRIIQNQLVSSLLFLFVDLEYKNSIGKRINEVKYVSSIVMQYEWFKIKNYNKFYLPVYLNIKFKGNYFFDLLTKLLIQLRSVKQKIKLI